MGGVVCPCGALAYWFGMHKLGFAYNGCPSPNPDRLRNVKTLNSFVRLASADFKMRERAMALEMQDIARCQIMEATSARKEMESRCPASFAVRFAPEFSRGAGSRQQDTPPHPGGV